MSQKDRDAADRLEVYINASQQGKPRFEEEYPLVDQLLAVAHSVEARPALKERITEAVNAKAIVRRPVRWAGVVAAVAVVLIAFLTIPPLRTLARSIIGVFAVQETDTDPALQPTAEPPAGVSPAQSEAPHPEPSYGLTLDQLRQEVAASADITLDVATPSYLPAGFGFDSGAVDEFGRMVMLIYVSADRLSLFQVRMHDLANPNPAVEVQVPLGASAEVEEVTVNGLAGQYAQGEYGVDGTWDATAPVRTLAWSSQGVLYVITTYDQNNQISRDDLMAIAKSIIQ